MDLPHEDSCTGCGACSNVCPKNCIQIRYNDQGFLIPETDRNICINCGACTRSCPVISFSRKASEQNPKVFSCWIKDENVRKKSTSGGVFFALAKAVLNGNGVVFASAMDGTLNVTFRRIESVDDLASAQGSKYIQSFAGDVYSQVKKVLIQKRPVLFIGCPCQVAALYTFLGKTYTNLFTADLICHGVASKKYFDEYVEYYNKKHKSKMIGYYPRNKSNGWTRLTVKQVYENGKENYIDSNRDYFMRPYYSALFYRKSCYNCRFNGLPRVADITLGDFFSLRDDVNYQEQLYNGISMVMINNEHGMNLFDRIKSDVSYFKRTLEEVEKNNLNLVKSCKYHRNRDKFLSKKRHCLPLVNILYTPRNWKNMILLLLGTKAMETYHKYKSNRN